MDSALKPSARNSLLAADEPGPFELFNAGGGAPVLVICDHASNFVPRALDRLGLDDSDLARHIAWDIGIAETARALARALDAPLLLSHFSRLIIDPNRKLTAPGSIPQESDGTPIPANRSLTSKDKTARVETFFQPYHEELRAQLDRLGARDPGPVLISMHSFTPVMAGFERPWQIGVLWDRDPRLPVPLMAALRAEGIIVGDNEPYTGRDHHGYTQHRHGDDRGLANALIEVRQDLIDTSEGAERWAKLLYDVLSEVLTDRELYMRGSK